MTAGELLAVMILFWGIGYPLAYFRRRHFGGPNFGPAAIVIVLALTAAPFLRLLATPPQLPACDQPEVIAMVEKALQGTPAGPSVRSISGHREVLYDPATGTRVGRCTVLKTDGRTVELGYVVEWMDLGSGQFKVRTFLPP